MPVSYLVGRIILFGSGWAAAGLCAYAANEMVTGAKWLVFAALAGWWTYVCALYVAVEAERAQR